MHLKWSRGFSFSELLRTPALQKQFNCPGVYVHIDNRPGVAYVGKASGSPSLWLRQYQHYVQFVGGLYLLPAEAGDTDNYAWHPGPDIEGNLNTVFNRALFGKVVDLAFAYVPNISIHLCPLKSDEAKTAERELLWALQPRDTVRGTRTPPKQDVSFVHECRNFTDLQKRLRNDRGNHTFEVTGNPLA